MLSNSELLLFLTFDVRFLQNSAVKLLILKFLLAIAAVFPGEPAPPGYEDEVSVVSFLESSGNKQDKPLIGMEYVVELTDDKAKEPFYVCTLCDKRCDPRNIIAQITSHRHRMKFLVRQLMNKANEKHFVIFC